MKKLILITSLMAFVGCAPQVEVVRSYDESSGYNKAADLETRKRFSSVVEQICTPMSTDYSADLGELTDSIARRNSRLSLDGSHVLPPGAEYGCELRTTYKPLFVLPRRSKVDGFSFSTSDSATVVATSLPLCMLVGEAEQLELDLDPRPELDSVTLSAASSSDCLNIAETSEGAGSSFIISVECAAEATIRFIANNREQIDVPNPVHLVLLPDLGRPELLNAEVGDYVVPEESETEGGGNSGQLPLFREVTLHWSARDDLLESAFQLFEQGRAVPIQEAIFSEHSRSFRTELEVGKDYNWRLRGKYRDCDGTGWSEWSGPFPFFVED